MKVFIFLINNNVSDIFNNEEKANEMYKKYKKYWNRNRFELGVKSCEVEADKECWCLSYNDRLVGVFGNEKDAWKENSKYHRQQFDTNVSRRKILSDLDDYWKEMFEKEIQKEKQFNEQFEKAWQELINPIKHTLI